MTSVKSHSSAAIAGVSTDASQRLTGVQRYTYWSERKTTLEICRDLNTPRSMAVWYLLSEDSHESIQQLLLNGYNLHLE
jgi:hypothetical protein